MENLLNANAAITASVRGLLAAILKKILRELRASL